MTAAIHQLILIVEDALGENVMKKMLESSGRNFQAINVIPWSKDRIREKAEDINRAAKSHGYLILTDQDTKDRCPPNAIKEMREDIHPNLLYRFAIMEIEAWVMAHREAFAKFLSVPARKIPDNTEEIEKPKEYLIELAKSSRSRSIRNDLIPRANSTSKVGPDYNGRLGEFVRSHWDVNAAARHSPSLKRTFKKLKHFTPCLT